jgi:uncharacterized surface protein with fasciclin (FAS1) repeats
MLKLFKTSHLILIFYLFALLSLSSCLNDSNNTSTEPESDLITTAESFDQLGTFSEYADSVDIMNQLSDSDNYTLFAPVNDAFSDEMFDTLSQKQLTDIISYHLADTALFTQQLDVTQQIQSLFGEDIYVSLGSNFISVNDGELVDGNIQATNGVLHASNTVLLPDTYLNVGRLIAKRYNLSTMESAIESAELADTLSEDTENGFTVFAPSNSAFESVSPPDNQEALEDTIRYHVIPQEFRADDFESSQMLETLNGQELKVGVNDTTITVNDSVTVILSDIEGTNGVVHIIDTFLTSPSEE